MTMVMIAVTVKKKTGAAMKPARREFLRRRTRYFVSRYTMEEKTAEMPGACERCKLRDGQTRAEN